MAYFAPFIDASGLHICTYQDLEDKLVQDAKNTFGDDNYLGPDSLDYQDITTRAQGQYDAMLAVQLAYNSRSPVHAQDNALDGLVALNGIKRQGATASVVTVDLTGAPFTAIPNGIVADVNGQLWDLPASVVLDNSGAASVTATCQTTGPVTALVGQVSIILTPTQGWNFAYNNLAATPGRAVESNAALQARQANSVANPAQALTTGILGAVLAVPNVTSAQIYENDSNAVQYVINGVSNPGGFPAHSLTLVVSGGDGASIANAMALRKTPGAYTNGDQLYVVTDRYGTLSTMRFYLPSNQTIDIAITVKALAGYTSAIGDAIKAAMVAYINSLVAGQNIIISQLEYAAVSANPRPQSPFFSVTSLTAAIDGNTLGTSDITMNFNQQPVTSLVSLSLTVT